jgi:hypothetical protein
MVILLIMVEVVEVVIVKAVGIVQFLLSVMVVMESMFLFVGSANGLRVEVVEAGEQSRL